MDDRRKRLLYRATHRGTREADRLVGDYAEAHLLDLESDLLDTFEALLDEADVDLVGWIFGRIAPFPGRYRAILTRMIDFQKNL